MPDGHQVQASGKGIMVVQTGDTKVGLQNASFVPEFKREFVLVPKATDNGVDVLFQKSGVKVIDVNTKDVVMTGTRFGDLYYLNTSGTSSNLADTTMSNTANLWQYCLGHRNMGDLKKMVNKKMADGVSIKLSDILSFCEDCCKAKSTKKPVGKGMSHEEAVKLEICESFHADLVGPFPVETPDKKRYALCISDRRSHYCWVFLIRNKSESTQMLKDFFLEIQRKFGSRNQVLTTFRNENGGEFMFKTLSF